MSDQAMTEQEHPDTASAYRLAELLGDLPHPDDFGPEAYELVERTRDLVAAVSANDADPATRAEIAATLADLTERLRATPATPTSWWPKTTTAPSTTSPKPDQEDSTPTPLASSSAQCRCPTPMRNQVQ